MTVPSVAGGAVEHGPMSLRGRVAVVTGATSGLGRWAAQGLAALQATTVVVGRGEERTAAVARAISLQTQNPDVVAVAVSDLALRSEASRLARVLLDRYAQVHMLLNNAGAYFHRREVTPEGLERTFALNVLAPYLLTTLLSPRLAAGAPSRVVMVTSAAHFGQTLHLDDLQSEHDYRGFRTYGRSKLELLLLTRELARQLADQRVTVNAIHPGFVRSGFARNNGGAVGATIGFLSLLFGRNVRRAASDLVFAVSDPSLGSATGQYLSRRRLEDGSPQSRDPDGARRLTEACAELARPYL